MLPFVLEKIKSKKWMILCLLIGNILMIAIGSGSPIYSEAVLQRMLTRNLTSYTEQNDRYAGITVMRQSFQKTVNRAASLAQIDLFWDYYENMEEELSLTSLSKAVSYTVGFTVVPEIKGTEDELSLQLMAQTDFLDHVTIKEGEFAAPGVLEDGTLEIIVSEETMMEQNLLLGESLFSTDHTTKDGVPITLKVVGVYERIDESDPYWLTVGKVLKQNGIVDLETLQQDVIQIDEPVCNFSVNFYNVMDYTSIEASQVETLREKLTVYENAASISGSSFSCNYIDILDDYLPEAQKLNVTLWALQIPVFVLLLVFIFMVSRQMVEMEEGEIAVMKSRGASKKQLLQLYLLQSGIVALCGVVLGIPLGLLICQVLGSCNAFLEFVSRTALQLKVSWLALLFAAVGALISVLTMVVPVVKYSSVTIVAQKQSKAKKKTTPFWQKMGLDILLLLVSGYSLFNFNRQRDLLAQEVAQGGSMDPLLYLSSPLFMLGAGLLFLRLFPFLLKLIFQVGKKFWPPSLYVSFLRMMRTKENQGFLMIFLVFTAALGIFSAQAARTINAGAEERLRYQNGADVVLKEEWRNNSEMVAQDTTGTLTLSYMEPDFSKYTSLEGVESLTQVFYDTRGSASSKVELGRGAMRNLTIMGIDTKGFGETAYMKDGLLPIHWYHYLNAISQTPDAILVSRSFETVCGYSLGDVVTYQNSDGLSTRGVIYGFIDYFPTFAPTSTVVDQDGNFTENSNFLIVANLGRLQSEWGVIPYEIWIKLSGSSQVVYDFAAETGTSFVTFKDTEADLIALKNDPIFQGTNGVLTVGFIVVLLLCVVGFLIYWILSIRSRSLQFGIFRAMGMTLKEILSMLAVEQIFISGLSIAVGVGIGTIASRLFVPLIQIAYTTADQVLPLEIVDLASDYIRILGVLGVVMICCLGVLSYIVSKIKISQALKLGED